MTINHQVKAGGKAGTSLSSHKGWSRHLQLYGADERTLLVTLTHFILPKPSRLHLCSLHCSSTKLISPVTLIHPDLHIMVTASTFPLINSPGGHFTLLAAW